MGVLRHESSKRPQRTHHTVRISIDHILRFTSYFRKEGWRYVGNRCVRASASASCSLVSMTYATSTKELSRYLPELFPHKVTQPWEGTHTDLLALLEIPPYPRQRPWSARLLSITPPLGRVDG